MVKAAKKEKRMDVPIDLIDPSPAFSVRHEPNLQAVEDFAEADSSGVIFPPAYAYSWSERDKSGFFLADGGHRLRARKQNKKKTLACIVVQCESKEEAERSAVERAIGSNVDHGVRRTADDKRAAVTTAMLRKEYQDQSDRSIAELCHVSGPFVRMVRERLTREGRLEGSAAAGTHRYKEAGSGYSAYASRKEGEGIKPVVEKQAAAAQPISQHPKNQLDQMLKDCPELDLTFSELRAFRVAGVTTLSQAIHQIDSGETFGMIQSRVEEIRAAIEKIVYPDEGDEEVPLVPSAYGPSESVEEAPEPEKACDEAGRELPIHLVAVFDDLKIFRSFSSAVGDLIRSLESSIATHPGCAAILLDTAKTDATNLSRGVAGAAPYCVCPSCDGIGKQGKSPCPTCGPGDKKTPGRGWLSRMRYKQLGPDLKSVVDAYGEEKPSEQT